MWLSTPVIPAGARSRISSRRVPMGGCSGAPLLALVEQRGIFSWRLGGVLYESESMFIEVARADCLIADGTINRYTNPTEFVRLERKRRDRDEDGSA